MLSLASGVQRRARCGKRVVLVAAGVLQHRPQSLHRGRELGELIEMLDGEPGESLGAVGREREPNDAMLVRVGSPLHERRCLGSIDELNHAVMAQQQQLGDLADRRSLRASVPADREQQLVLCRGQPRGFRLLFAPLQEAAQTRSQLQQVGVVVVCWGQSHIVPRYQEHSLISREGITTRPRPRDAGRDVAGEFQL